MGFTMYLWAINRFRLDFLSINLISAFKPPFKEGGRVYTKIEVKSLIILLILDLIGTIGRGVTAYH